MDVGQVEGTIPGEIVLFLVAFILRRSLLYNRWEGRRMRCMRHLHGGLKELGGFEHRFIIHFSTMSFTTVGLPASSTVSSSGRRAFTLRLATTPRWSEVVGEFGHVA